MWAKIKLGDTNMATRTLALFFSIAISLSGVVSAATLSWGTHGNPYEYSGRATNWDQNIESESSSVTKSGSYYNYNVDGGATPWGSGTWLWSAGGYVEMSFTTPADTLFIQFQSDGDDGWANFIVDDVSVGSFYTRNKGWVQVMISDLTLGLHTLRVTNAGGGVLAFDNFGALNTTPVPIPAALPLFAAGFGLMGLIGRKRRLKSAV
jgi:hypothetical protein